MNRGGFLSKLFSTTRLTKRDKKTWWGMAAIVAVCLVAMVLLFVLAKPSKGAWPDDNTTLNSGAIPYALRYVHPTTGETVEVCTGPLLDVTRQTPYGIQRDTSDPSPTNITEAIQWAIDYCREPDPAARIPAGGPRGTFEPYIGGNTASPYAAWVCKTPIWLRPNRWSLSLRGAGHGYANETVQQGAATRLLYDPDPAWVGEPMVICQAANARIENICFLGRINDTTGSRQPLGWVNTMIRAAQTATHPFYYSGFNTSQDGFPTTDVQLKNCAFAGWDVCVQNGGTLADYNCDHMTVEKCYHRDCGTFWRNENQQGLACYFRENTGDAGTWYDFEAGGKSWFCGDVPYKSGTIYLNIGPQSGKNDGAFFLDGICFDNSVGPNAYLVHMETRSGLSSLVTIAVRGGCNSAAFDAFPTAFVKLSSNTDFSIDGYKGLGPFETSTVTASGKVWRPRVLVTNSTINSSDANLVLETKLMLSAAGTYELEHDHVSQNTNSTSAASYTPRPRFVTALPEARVVNVTVPATWLAQVATETAGYLPKAGQPLELAYNVADAAAEVSASLDDIEWVRVVVNERRASGTVWDQRSDDVSGRVTAADSEGVGTWKLEASDFVAGGGSLKAGWKYWIVYEVKFAGEDPVELRPPYRLELQHEQLAE